MIRRTTKLLLEVLALICAGLTILLIMAAIKLATGPLSVGFIAPTIVEALEPEDGSLRVSLEDAVLTWGGWQRTLQLRAVGVKVSDPSGEVRAEIPELTIGFSGRALLDGQLAPTTLEVVGPRIALVRTEEGAIRVADPAPPPSQVPPQAPQPEEGERPRLAGDFVSHVFGDLLAPPGPSNKLGYLSSLSILDADLTLEDRKLDLTWRAPSATFVVLKTGDGLRLKGTFGIAIGGETAEFALDAEYNTSEERVGARIDLADIQPARFAAAAPLFEPLAGIKLPLSGALRLRAGFDGTVQEVALDLTGGAGTILLPWEAAGADLPVRGLRLRSSLTRDLTVAELSELSLDLDGPAIKASASVQGVSQGIVGGPFEASAELQVNGLGVPLLKRLWPEFVAPNAHRWVAANIHEGLVSNGRLALSGTAGEDGLAGFEVADMSGGFAFQDVSVSYFADLPPIRKGQGQATLTKEALSFKVGSAEVERMAVGPAKVDITGLDITDQRLAVETVVRGSLRQVLTLLDHPKLGYAKALGVKPADVGGEAAVRLQVRMPLIDAVTFKQVAIAAAANLRDVTLPKAAFDLDLTRGNFTLQLDGRGMDITGTAVLGPTPINLTWVENFAPGGFARQFRIAATVDDEGRRGMKLDLGDYLSGPVGIDAVMTQNTNRANTLTLNADLTRATLDVSELAWRKEAGTAGKLRAELALTGDKPTAVKDFALTADGFSAAGNLAFADDGKTVSKAHLDRLAYGRSDVTVDLARRADGGLDLSLTGKSFDAAPFLKSDKEQAAAAAKEADEPKLMPLRVALTLETLYLGKDGGLANVSARLQRNTRHWRSVTLDGQPAPDKFFSLAIAPDGSNRRLTVRSDDAGAVFRALDISENLLGGRLQLTGSFDDATRGEPLYGKLEVESFRLVKAPAIAKLLSVALLTGVLDALRGAGIGFDRLEAPFTIKDDVIETKNARAHGPALGITAEGWINIRNETVGLRGTIVPAYAVNSILNNIPLIGGLLGGSGSGIFAATYRMTGNLDDPDISVNPLATLAPGFLRGVFGIFEGGVPQQPDALPDPSLDKEVPLPAPPQRD